MTVLLRAGNNTVHPWWWASEVRNM